MMIPSLKNLALEPAWASGKLEKLRRELLMKSNQPDEGNLFYQLTGETPTKPLTTYRKIDRVPNESEEEYLLRQYRVDIDNLFCNQNYGFALKIAATHPISRQYALKKIDEFCSNLESKFNCSTEIADGFRSDKYALLGRVNHSDFTTLITLMYQAMDEKFFVQGYLKRSNQRSLLGIAVGRDDEIALVIMRTALGDADFAKECLRPIYHYGESAANISCTSGMLNFMRHTVGDKAFAEECLRPLSDGDNLLIRALLFGSTETRTLMRTAVGDDTLTEECLKPHRNLSLIDQALFQGKDDFLHHPEKLLLFLASIDSAKLRKACLPHKVRIIRWTVAGHSEDQAMLLQLDNKNSGFSKFYAEAIGDWWFKLLHYNLITKIEKYRKIIKANTNPPTQENSQGESTLQPESIHPSPLAGGIPRVDPAEAMITEQESNSSNPTPR